MCQLTRYQIQPKFANRETVKVTPQDKPRILQVLQLMQTWGGNELHGTVTEAQIYFVQEGDRYHLMAYPNTTRLSYLTYDAKEHTLTSAPRHILIRALITTMSKAGFDTKDFEETAKKYQGSDFLLRLFGLSGNQPILQPKRKALPNGNKIRGK
jgi:hypothetical protein